jgi:hypothetical protein
MEPVGVYRSRSPARKTTISIPHRVDAAMVPIREADATPVDRNACQIQPRSLMRAVRVRRSVTRWSYSVIVDITVSSCPSPGSIGPVSGYGDSMPPHGAPRIDRLADIAAGGLGAVDT